MNQVKLSEGGSLNEGMKMDEEIKVPLSIDCWYCGTHMTLLERAENAGECPCCDAEIDLDPYLAKALAGYAARDARIAELRSELVRQAIDNNQLRAELAAAKETITRYETTAENCDLLRAELAAIKGQVAASTEFKQFMTSVVTAAGLLSYGKQSKGLAAEISASAYKYLLAAPVAKQVVMPNELEEFERWITDKSGPHALKKWPTDTALAYENYRVQDYRTGWVECLNRLNAADQAEGNQDE